EGTGAAREGDPRRYRRDVVVCADCKPQTGQEEFAVLGIPQVAGIRYQDGADGAEARDDFSRLGEASHMGIAGDEKAIRHRETWILLDRKEQFRYRLVEPPSQ